MNVISIGLKALKDIIDNKKPSHAVMLSFGSEFNLNKDDHKRLEEIVLGSMKHFLALSYEARETYKDFGPDDDEIYLLVIAIYEIRYCQRIIASFQVIAEAKEAVSLGGLRFDENDLDKKLTDLASHPFTLPEELKSDTFKYNSLFFSTPEWLIKMWAAQYGDQTCMNILISNQKNATQYIRVNQAKATKEELLSEQIYKECPETDNGLVYISPRHFSTQKDAKEGKAFVQDLSLQLMLDALTYSRGMKALHICGITSSVASNLASRLVILGGQVEASFLGEQNYRKAVYQFLRLGLLNAKAYYGDIDRLRTFCAFSSYDLVLVTPPSTYLGQIRRRPGLLAMMEMDDMNKLIVRQKELLEEASMYAVSGGELVYSVQTINLKEGKNVVMAFLDAHKEYELVSEKQIFPYDYNSDGLYYAVMKRGNDGRHN